MNHIGFVIIQPAYAFSGLLVGLLVGMTGVGGGSLMTPLLVLVFGLHPSTAVGTDLLFASVTKTVGTTIHSAGKTVDWRIVARLAAGSVPATLITLLVLGWAGANNRHVVDAISYTLGGTLVISSVTLIFKDGIIARASRRFPRLNQGSPAWMTVLVGLVLGVLVSLTSVGAGALGTIALLLLYPKLPIVKIVGSDIAHAVPLTLLAGLGHWYLGTVNFMLLGSLLAGSIPGIILGSVAARYAPDTLLKTILGVILALVGVRMLVK
jgi:uncharacterized membrane protein YfcA